VHLASSTLGGKVIECLGGLVTLTKLNRLVQDRFYDQLITSQTIYVLNSSLIDTN